MKSNRNVNSSRFHIPITESKRNLRALPFRSKRVETIRTPKLSTTSRVSQNPKITQSNHHIVIHRNDPRKRIVAVSRSPSVRIISRTKSRDIVPTGKQLPIRKISPVSNIDMKIDFERFSSTKDDGKEKRIEILERENREIKGLLTRLGEGKTTAEQSNADIMGQLRKLGKELAILKKEKKETSERNIEKEMVEEVKGFKRETGRDNFYNSKEKEAMEEENDQLKNRIKELEEQNKEISVLKKDIEKRKTEIWSKHKELGEANGVIKNNKTQMENQERKIETLSDQVEFLRERNENLNRFKEERFIYEQNADGYKEDLRIAKKELKEFKRNSLPISNVNSFKLEIQEKDITIEALKADIEDKENKNKEFNSTIIELNKELTALKCGQETVIDIKNSMINLKSTLETEKTKLNEKEAEILSLVKSNTEKETELFSLRVAIENKEKLLKDKDDIERNMTETIEQLKNELVEKDKLIEEQKDKEETHNDAIKVLESDIKNKKTDLNILKEEFEESLEDNKKLKDTIYERERRIDELENDIEEKDRKITLIEDGNKNWNERIEELNTNILEKDKRIEQLTFASKDDLDNIEDMRKKEKSYLDAIEELKANLEKNDVELLNKEKNEFEERFKDIENQLKINKETLNKKQNTIEEYKNMLDDSQNKHKKLLEELEELRTENNNNKKNNKSNIEKLKTDINNKNTEIENYKEIVLSKDEELNILNKELKYFEKFNLVISNKESMNPKEFENDYQRILNYDSNDITQEKIKIDENLLHTEVEQQPKLSPKIKTKRTPIIVEESINTQWKKIVNETDVKVSKENPKLYEGEFEESEQMMKKLISKDKFLGINDFHVLDRKSQSGRYIKEVNENDEYKALVEELQCEIEILKSKIEILKEENKELKEENNNYQSNDPNVSSEVKNLRNVLSEYNLTISNLENEKANFVNELTSIIKELQINPQIKSEFIKQINTENALPMLKRTIELVAEESNKIVTDEISQQREENSDNSLQRTLKTSKESEKELIKETRLKLKDELAKNNQLSDKIMALYDQINKYEQEIKGLRLQLNQSKTTNELNKELIGFKSNESGENNWEEAYLEIYSEKEKLEREYGELLEKYQSVLTRVTSRRNHILSELNSFGKMKTEFDTNLFSELTRE